MTKYILYIYVLLVVVTGADAWAKSGLFVGVAGLLAPALACWAGIGVKASMYVDGIPSKLIAIVIGLVMYVIADWLVTSSGFYVTLFDVILGGGIWILLGLLISLIATKKQHTVKAS